MNADDEVLEAIERWKKRAISAFALLSLLVAILVALIIELGALVHTVQHEFHGSVNSLSDEVPHLKACAFCRHDVKSSLRLFTIPPFHHDENICL